MRMIDWSAIPASYQVVNLERNIQVGFDSGTEVLWCEIVFRLMLRMSGCVASGMAVAGEEAKTEVPHLHGGALVGPPCRGPRPGPGSAYCLVHYVQGNLRTRQLRQTCLW